MSKLIFPVEVLNQHMVVLGKTGAGKSSALRHAVEYLLEHKKRVVIIDIKGDWWGLKSAADGKAPGFPIVAFGNFREPKATDVPINAQSGKHVAELITSGNRPCIIGFRGWMPHEITEFWIGTEGNRWHGFASTLFNANEGELFVVISECHNFAPKGKNPDPRSARVLHWTNRLLAEGRGLGMTFLLDSQRPQKVHNDVLTACETLLAMRLTHPADREAVQAWINGCGDKAVGVEVVNTLAQMERGEGWLWSPEIGLGPKRVKFPMFQTFDSFASSKVMKKVSDAGWSSVDLDAVKEKLASVIKEAEANDPKALKLQIDRLKKEMAQVSKPHPQAPVTQAGISQKELDAHLAEYKRALEDCMKIIVRINAQGFDGTAITPDEVKAALDASVHQIAKMVEVQYEEHIQLLKILKRDANSLTARVNALIGKDKKIDIAVDVKHQQPFKLTTPFRPKTIQPRRESNGNCALPEGERAILIALAQCGEDGADRTQLSVLTGYKKSTRNAYLQRLSTKGYIDGGDSDRLRASESGIAALGDDYQPLPTGHDLYEWWMNRLPEGEGKLLNVLQQSFPESVDRETLSTATGFQKSTRNAYLQRMAAKKIIAQSGNKVVMSKELNG